MAESAVEIPTETQRCRCTPIPCMPMPAVSEWSPSQSRRVRCSWLRWSQARARPGRGTRWFGWVRVHSRIREEWNLRCPGAVFMCLCMYVCMYVCMYGKGRVLHIHERDQTIECSMFDVQTSVLVICGRQRQTTSSSSQLPSTTSPYIRACCSRVGAISVSISPITTGGQDMVTLGMAMLFSDGSAGIGSLESKYGPVPYSVSPSHWNGRMIIPPPAAPPRVLPGCSLRHMRRWRLIAA
jgi:hypothetical protein